MTRTIPDGLAAHLNQDHAWHAIGDDGRLYRRPLTDMTHAQRRRVINHLRTHAAALHDQHRRALHTELQTGRDYAEIVSDLARHNRTEPEQWLEHTPLMRRLCELTPEQPAPAARRWAIGRWFR